MILLTLIILKSILEYNHIRFLTIILMLTDSSRQRFWNQSKSNTELIWVVIVKYSVIMNPATCGIYLLTDGIMPA